MAQCHSHRPYRPHVILCGARWDNAVRTTRRVSSFAPKSSMLGQWIRSSVWTCAQRQNIVIRQRPRFREGRVAKMDTSQRERLVAKLDTFRRCRCLPIVCRSASSSWAGPSENSPGAPASTARRSGDGWAGLRKRNRFLRREMARGAGRCPCCQSRPTAKASFDS